MPLMNIGGGIAYVGFTLLVVRPLLRRWAARHRRTRPALRREFVICLVCMALGAWFTDEIGLPTFGQFGTGSTVLSSERAPILPPHALDGTQDADVAPFPVRPR